MDQGDIDLRAVASVMRRQFRLTAMVTIVVTLLAGISTLFLPQIYSATALVLVDPRSKDLLAPDEVAFGSPSDMSRIDSEAEILRSDAIMLQALRSLGRLDATEAGDKAGLASAVHQLRSAVHVQRRAATHILAIEARSQNPSEAARIANTVAAVYIEAQLALKISSVIAARDMLQSRIELARDALGQANRQNGNTDQELSISLLRSQYNHLLARAQDLDAQTGLQLADSSVVSPAITPDFPSFPDHKLILALAALAGLGGGIGLAFLRENIVGGLTSEEQVSALLAIPVVTAVPAVRTDPTMLGASDLVINAPLSGFSETIRRVRSSADQALRNRARGDASGAVIMVTSSIPEEGKTTLSLSLARSYAQAGHKAILIDCDLRKPSVHRHLGLAPSEGLYDFLDHRGEDHALLNAITSRDPQSQATVILGAHQSTTPTDQLLSGTAFPRLIEAAQKVFDVVILDTPPLGPVVDGLYLAPHADIVVFVTKYATTPQAEARHSLARLTAALRPGINVIAVLNQQSGSGDYSSATYPNYHRQQIATHKALPDWTERWKRSAKRL